MPFIEQRLLDCVSYGTAGGPTWSTRKVNLNSGICRRNPQRTRPLYQFAVIYKNLDDADHEDVIAAFNACMGGALSFRIKDWSDFQAVGEEFAVLGTGSAQTLQLTKSYTFGDQTVVRPIRKPVTGSVVVKANGSTVSSTVDSVGRATFTATSGDVLTWSGEFDVPVYFSDDDLSFSIDDGAEGNRFLTSDVSLEEDISI